jgi:S-adenosylmethionine:tRNA ribosyltransferase-isomerase
MKTADFHFDLPEHLIAQSPLEERTSSRLLALDGATGRLDHRQFLEIEALLNPNDLLVFNNTRVIPARLYGQKQTGGRVEILIERLRGDGSVLAHVRASKSPKEGSLIFITADQDSDITDFTLRVCGRDGGLFELEAETGTGCKDDAVVRTYAATSVHRTLQIQHKTVSVIKRSMQSMKALLPLLLQGFTSTKLCSRDSA